MKVLYTHPMTAVGPTAGRNVVLSEAYLRENCVVAWNPRWVTDLRSNILSIVFFELGRGR